MNNSKNNMIPASLDDLGYGLIQVDKRNYIRMVNDGAENLFGIASNEVIGRKIEEVFSHPTINEFSNKTAETREFLGNIEIAVTEPEEKVIVMNISPLFGKDDQYEGLLLLFTDVTQKSKLQTNLSQQGQLSTVGTLSSWAAHEVRNPLTSINVHLELLKGEIFDEKGSKKEALSLIDSIQEEVERLDYNLKKFLEFGKFPPPRTKPLHINQLITSMVEFVRAEAQLSRVKIATHLDFSLNKLRLDENQMRIVLLNLIKNSIQAMPEGGDLIISTQKKEKQVEISVFDTGVGLTLESQDKIFDFLYSTKSGGSGLGLPIVKKIVGEHGGKIKMESEAGKGTKMILIFPLKD